MIYFLYGSDTYRSRQRLREIISAYRKKSGGMLGYARYDAEEDNLFEKLPSHTATLFRQKTLLVIENALNAKKDYAKLLEARSAAWQDDADTIVILWERQIPEKKKNIVKFLTEHAAKTQEFRAPDRVMLRRILAEETKERGVVIDREAEEALLSSARDSWDLARELEKYELMQVNAKRQTLNATRPTLNAQHLTTNAEPRTPNAKHFPPFSVQRSAFGVSLIKPYHLADAVIEGRVDAVRLLYILKKSSAIDDIILLGIFVNAVRGMLLLKSARNASERMQVARNEGMHDFVARKYAAQSERFSADELKKIYRRLLDADILAKTGSLPAESIVMRVVETGLRFDIPFSISE
jgi:DNA polymerase III delta subunit